MKFRQEGIRREETQFFCHVWRDGHGYFRSLSKMEFTVSVVSGLSPVNRVKRAEDNNQHNRGVEHKVDSEFFFVDIFHSEWRFKE